MDGAKTYISSLLTDADKDAMGIYVGKDSGVPIFYGNVWVKTAIVFPDGSTMSSAGTGLPSNIDEGTF